MQVNITLLLQACNFFVAWFLLHKLFFKPAIAVLEQEQKVHDSIVSSKNAHQEYITIKQQEISSCRYEVKQFYRQLMGHEEPVFLYNEPLSTQSFVSNLEIASDRKVLVQEFTDKIIEEVLHVEL